MEPSFPVVARPRRSAHPLDGKGAWVPRPGTGSAREEITVRLFVAVTSDRPAADHLAAALAPVRERPGAPRWTAPELRHLTLVFLGEVDEATAARLPDRFVGVASRHRAVRLRLAGAGTFPPRGAPRVLWIGVDGEPHDLDGLRRLASDLARTARSLRIPVERRPFRPHVTVGRWRQGDPVDPTVVAELSAYRGPDLHLHRFVLLRSHLGPRPRYAELGSWELGPRTGTAN